MTRFETIMAVLNLVAIVGIPILAVVIGQYLQNRAEKRKDKMQIFRTLMTSRIYGWTVDSVHALNLIDVVLQKILLSEALGKPFRCIFIFGRI